MADATDTTFLTHAQLRARWGDVSQMFIARRLKGDAEFSRPTKIGALLFWKLADIEAYERTCTLRTERRRVG